MRERKVKSVSPYWTRYFRFLYVPVRLEREGDAPLGEELLRDVDLGLPLEHAVVLPLREEPERGHEDQLYVERPRSSAPTCSTWRQSPVQVRASCSSVSLRTVNVMGCPATA
jgi:hypothetical protein